MNENDRILVTGFEPFGGESLNPSAYILEKIHQDNKLSMQCDTLLLPVDFGEAHRPVLERLKANQYKAWVGFGQAGGRSRICLERVALNWVETKQADNRGLVPTSGPLVHGASAALFSTAPLEKIKSVLEVAGLPAEISHSAGAYVCNSLYFHVLNNLATESWGLFIHVPYMTEQIQNKGEAVPSWDSSDLWQATSLVLTTVLHA